MAVYAVGDVQGCCDELETLLERIGFDPARDRLWFTGDLVNRGPRSVDTLRLVRALGDAAIVVLGNHDLRLLEVASAPGRKLGAKDTLHDVLAAADREELVDWLRRRPLLHHDGNLGLTLIHAGLAPEWDFATARACAREVEAALRDVSAARELYDGMRGDPPARWYDTLAGLDRLRFIVSCLTRLRYCHADGRIDLRYSGPPEKAPAGLLPWFRVPDRRSRALRIVTGHWAALGFHDGDGVLAVDTGCVWGGSLCAARLDRPARPVLLPCRSPGYAGGD